MTLPQSLKQDFSRDTVVALSQYKKEPSWMTDLRLDAWKAYEKEPVASGVLGFPLQAIRSFLEHPTTAILSHEWPGDLQHAVEERGDEEGLIVQRDSTILSRSITKDQTKKGVIFTDLGTAMRLYSGLVRRYFAQQVKPDELFSSLSTAFWSGGTFLYVPEHVQVALPFHTCYWMTT